jgi:hypothetical protein
VRRGLADAFQDGAQVADRHPLAQQRLQHPLQGGGGDDGRDQVVGQLLLLGRQVLDQLLDLA